MSSLAIIIPCFNEAIRFDSTSFLALTSSEHDIHLYFVNDGSTDNTAEILDRFIEKMPLKSSIIHLSENKGKGEAVRHGMIEVLKHPYDFIAYYDADLATSTSEMVRLYEIANKKKIDAIIGSRIKKAGSVIYRSGFRHFIGRIIATIIDFRFKLGIYDTQCGAKIFSSQAIAKVVKEPFLTSWFFDVEIFLRLRKLEKIKWYEEPLLYWEDKSNSKLNFFSFPLIFKELAILMTKYQSYTAYVQK